MCSALAARSRARWLASLLSGLAGWLAVGCGQPTRLASSSCASGVVLSGLGGASLAWCFELISHLGPRDFLLVSFFWFSFPRCTGRGFRRLVLQEVLVLAN